MPNRAVTTENAPGAIGPYSQAVIAGELILISGQIPVDPATGEQVSGIENGTAQVLENIRAILEAAGGSMDDVIKTTVYMIDLEDFSEMNNVYARYFNEPYPARAAVQVGGLPKGVEVEIEAVAMRGERG